MKNRDESGPSEPDLAKIHKSLRSLREKAPDDLCGEIMNRLPKRRRAVIAWPVIPRPVLWTGTALAGAAAALLLLLAIEQTPPVVPAAGAAQTVRFHLHAPLARQVELAGTFNNWRAGEIVLVGPDADGQWHAEVSLPDGQHEYQFLVDGQEWVTDPRAAFHRPDGFGNFNAIVDVPETGKTS